MRGGAHGLDHLKTLEHLDARLGLTGLGGLVAEALDVAFQVRGRSLVGLTVGFLQTQVLHALHLVERVVAAVAVDGAVFDRPGRLHGPIEKLAVVADDDDGAREALEPGFQPNQAVQIEVVGRLVQEQELCGINEAARQRQAIAPAARKLLDAARLVTGGKPQTVHDRQGLGAHGAFVDFGQMRFGRGNAHVVAAVGRVQPFALGLCQGRVSFEHVRQGLVVGFGDGLGDFAHQLGHVDGAAFRIEFAQNGGKKRGFAAAVFPHERDALAVGGDQIDVVVERARAAHDRKVVDSEHGKNERAHVLRCALVRNG